MGCSVGSDGDNVISIKVTVIDGQTKDPVSGAKVALLGVHTIGEYGGGGRRTIVGYRPCNSKGEIIFNLLSYDASRVDIVKAEKFGYGSAQVQYNLEKELVIHL